MLVHIKSLEEINLADKEQRGHIAAGIGAHLFDINTNHLGHLAAEEDGRQRHTGQTPKARLWGCEHGDGEVISITAVSLTGMRAKRRRPAISAVLMAMLIITATKAAIGICEPRPGSRIIASRLTPENKVESRVRPPLSMFITDCPTSAAGHAAKERDDVGDP